MRLTPHTLRRARPRPPSSLVMIISHRLLTPRLDRRSRSVKLGIPRRLERLARNKPVRGRAEDGFGEDVDEVVGARVDVEVRRELGEEGGVVGGDCGFEACEGCGGGAEGGGGVDGEDWWEEGEEEEEEGFVSGTHCGWLGWNIVG